MQLKKTLGLFTLITMSIVAVFNPRSLPITAEYGFASITYYLIAALLFFIPHALTCAELATAWPKTGGPYIWVREAFGRRAGFLAIWLEWVSNTVGWPASLAFIAGILAYALHPSLIHNKVYIISIMLILFWFFTLINFLGIKIASWISSICLIIGTLLPVLLMIALSIGWVIAGNPIKIHMNLHALLPPMHLNSGALLIGVMLGFSGMYITAFHAGEVHNPQKNFPKAIFITMIIIVLCSTLGSLAIAIVIPQQQISLIGGNMQAIQVFFAHFHLTWLVPTMAVLIALGTAAMLNTWIAGPAKGLLAAAQFGDLPKIFTRTNKKNAPTTILAVQAIVVTLLALLFLYMPNINSSYWVITALSGITALLINMLLFAAVIYLRYKAPEQAHVNTPKAFQSDWSLMREAHPQTPSSSAKAVDPGNRIGLKSEGYKIPGGKLGVWLVAGIGFLSCLIGIAFAFIPPAQFATGGIKVYDTTIIVGFILLMSPVLFLRNR